jgi:hypothetical protein
MNLEGKCNAYNKRGKNLLSKTMTSNKRWPNTSWKKEKKRPNTSWKKKIPIPVGRKKKNAILVGRKKNK